MKHWGIWYRSEEIYGTPAQLVVDDRPAWAVAVSAVVGWVDDKVLRHKVCCPPEWVWKIPFGSRQRDEDGLLDKNLGAAIYGGFNRLIFLAEDRARHLSAIDVSREWLEKNGQKRDWDEGVEGVQS